MPSPCLVSFSWLLTFSTTGTFSSPPHGAQHVALSHRQHYHPVPLHLRRLRPHD